MITTACPRCRRSLSYQNEHAGLQGQCDGCGSVFVIPEPTTPTTPPPYPGGGQAGAQPGAQSSGNASLDSLAALSGGQQSGGYQQGGYQQGGYQGGYHPGGQQRYVGQSYMGMAVAGFILAFLFSIVGLILSIIALSGMKKSRNMEGHGLALAGLIISIVTIALGCVLAVAIGFASGMSAFR